MFQTSENTIVYDVEDLRKEDLNDSEKEMNICEPELLKPVSSF